MEKVYLVKNSEKRGGMENSVIKRYLYILVAVFLLIGSEVVFAQRSTNTEKCFVVGHAFFQESEYRLATADTDYLVRHHDYINYRMMLLKDVAYGFVACGDESFESLDIRVFDEQGKLVVHHKQPVNQPVVEITPNATGMYTVRIYSQGGYGDYTLLKMYRN